MDRQEERQRGQPVGLAAAIEIAIEDDRGEPAQAAMLQVHEQEGQVVEHIDIGDGRAELDPVEQGRPAVRKADVAEMQVAMAVPDAAGVAPAIEPGGLRGQRGAAVAVEAFDIAGGKPAGAGQPQVAAVAVDHPGHAGGAAEVARDLGRIVEGGDPVGEVAHQRRRQPAVLGHAIEQRRLVEAAHHQHPVDRRRRAEGEPARRVAAERANLEIEFGRGATVERELGAAGRLAQRNGRVVEVGEADRALQLVGVIPGEEDERGMGLDAFHRSGIGTVGVRPRQEGDDLALISAGSRLRFACHEER